MIPKSSIFVKISILKKSKNYKMISVKKLISSLLNIKKKLLKKKMWSKICKTKFFWEAKKSIPKHAQFTKAKRSKLFAINVLILAAQIVTSNAMAIIKISKILDIKSLILTVNLKSHLSHLSNLHMKQKLSLSSKIMKHK